MSAHPFTNVLHLGEAELRLGDGAGPQRQSPVVALLDGAEPRFGAAALQALTRDPRQLAEGYLRDLSTDAIGLRGAPHLSSADLLYRHLREFAADSATGAFVLSPALPSASLGLLLGIAHRAGLQPRALVDAAALAASIASKAGEHVTYVEAGVRDSSVAVVVPDGDEVARTHVLRVPGLGLRSASDLWLQHVRERSIALWRIDPLLDPTRAAAMLAHWPTAGDALLRGSDGSVEFEGGHRLDWVAATVLARLQEAARGLVDAVLAQSPVDGVVLLDSSVAAVPGLAAQLARYRETRTLAAGALARGLGRLAPLLAVKLDSGSAPPQQAGATSERADGVAHLLRLPRAPDGSDWQRVHEPAVTPLALLLVLGPHAHALQPGARLSLQGRGTAALLVASGPTHGERTAGGPTDGLPTDSLPPERSALLLHVHADHVVLAGTARPGVRVNGRLLTGTTVLRPGDMVRTEDGTNAQLIALLPGTTPAARVPDGARNHHGV